MASISISEPFIRRPVGTTLLAIGLFLVGMVAYVFLPVAAVPNVDFPMIRVSASRPGADPSIMAATVAAPLERRLGELAGPRIQTENEVEINVQQHEHDEGNHCLQCPMQGDLELFGADKY